MNNALCETIEKQSQVSIASERTRHSLDRLIDSVSKLEIKLSDVLRPEQQETDCCKEKQALVPLAQTMEEFSNRINSIDKKIIDIIDRLEV